MTMLSSSNTSIMPDRPGVGKRGQHIQLITNFLHVSTVPSADMHMYNVQITPAVPKAINRLVMSHLRDNFADLFEGNLTPAYDGMATMYYPRRMSWATRVEIVDLPDRRDKFTVKIEHVSVVSMNTLHAFLTGCDIDIPQDAIQALDVVLRATPMATCTSVGASFFSGRNTSPLHPGAEIWFGYHQSLRPVHGRLLVNLDIAHTCFHRPQPVIELIATVCKKKVSEITPANLAAIRMELSGIKVVTIHGCKRKYIIRDIARESANEVQFDMTDGIGTRRTSVTQYFQERYQTRLQYPDIPMLVVGSKEKQTYLPMEVCNVLAGIRIRKKLAPAQTAAMIKKTAAKPHIRLQNVRNVVKERSYESDPALKDFGIGITPEVIQVDGRVLEAPTIVYSPQSRIKSIKPNRGAWQPRDACLYSSNHINHWGVLVLEQRVSEDEVTKFLSILKAAAKEYGIPIQRPLRVMHRPQGRGNINYHQAIMSAVQKVQQETGCDCQLMLIILPFGDAPAYGEIKRICDTILDIPSQCMLSKHLQKADMMYARNLLLKMNARTGGVNNILSTSPSYEFLFGRPAIIIGADVTHPAPFSKQPSLCAVVASMDAYPFRYECETRPQKTRQEIIQDLKDMSMNLLKRFYTSTQGKKPERILFYRDGVSEGQFGQVLQFELNALRDACEALEAGYTPKITFIVVQKRHHARFFVAPSSIRDADRSGNVPAGTVVDTGIVHPRQFDFYLVAHAGLQGTSRPTHYHVLFDENKFTADLLQDITHRQCYMFARCTRAVSLVPAVYYAHLCAARARNHTNADEIEMRSGSASDTSVISSKGVIPTVLPKTASQMYFI